MQGEEACIPLARHRPCGGIGGKHSAHFGLSPCAGCACAMAQELRRATRVCRWHRRMALNPPPYSAGAQPRQMLYANAGARVARGRHGCQRGSLVARCERAILVLACGSSNTAAAFSLAAGGSPLAGSVQELAEASRVLSQLAFSFPDG